MRLGCMLWGKHRKTQWDSVMYHKSGEVGNAIEKTEMNREPMGL